VQLTDTHCHLYFDNYRDDFSAVLDRAQKAGIRRILVPAIDLQSCREVIDLVDQYSLLYGALGVHPNSASSWMEDTRQELQELADHPKIVAVGEIGLDYYRDRTPKKIQTQVLEEQLELASELCLPAVLHVRNRSAEDRSCIQDLLAILRSWVRGVDPSGGQVTGVIHSFSGNLEESIDAIDLGFLIGITGAVTFKNADMLRQIVMETTLEKLLVETDGPFITPEPYRGKRNEPAHVRHIIDKIGVVKRIPVEEVAKQTAANASRIFVWE
jgi:TatD DNase family protein